MPIKRYGGKTFRGSVTEGLNCLHENVNKVLSQIVSENLSHR